MNDFKLTVERSTAYQSGQQPQVTYNVIGSHADILEDLSIDEILELLELLKTAISSDPSQTNLKQKGTQS